MNLNQAAAFLFFIFFIALAGCREAPKKLKLFTLLAPSETNISFSNNLKADPNFNIIEYLYFYDGGGVAAGDINNDGLADIYFTANQLPNKLYLNKGNFEFKDITRQAAVAGKGDWKTGVCMADVNGDGFLDIYVSEVGDYKGITGANQLFINNGDLTFTERAKEYGLAFVGFSTQASFFDYDNDGDLDMYLLNHSVHTSKSYGPSTLRLGKDAKAGDKLFRNDFEDGQLHFVDVTEEAKIYSSHIGYGLGVSVGDINKDGCPDIFISNDFHENDYLYLNNCDGTFTESLAQSMGHASRSSMGNDLADFNNDGWLDLVVLDMLPDREDILKKSAGEDRMEIFQKKLDFGYYPQLVRNTLQLNRGNGLFSEIALLAGTYATDWSWTPLFGDFDNDGFKDLFVSNGIFKRPNDLDYVRYLSKLKTLSDHPSEKESRDRLLMEKMPSEKIANFVFQNNRDLTFTDKTLEWGLNQPVFSNGAVYADLDNDGDLDLIVNNINQEAFIYRNNSERLSKNNYLTVRLKGSGKNTSGIGAKVNLKSGGQLFYQEQMPVRGFQSSVENVLHFGLDRDSIIDTLQVIWPNRKAQILTAVPANQLILLEQKDASQDYSYSSPNNKPTLFEDISKAFKIDYKHTENKFSDFSRERLMPHKLSTQGPKLAVGDVNADGLEDFFVGGASRQVSQLFLQTKDGQFVDAKLPVFKEDRAAEDMEAKFLDVDGDEDLDLYVVSGGNEWVGDKEALKDRLYINNGAGAFAKSRDLLPEDFFANGSCVEAADFDGDGDLDLFVGSRSVVGKYGLNPRSYLLENDGHGKFRDVTEKIAPQLTHAGMVSDALWVDMNKDGQVDLMVVGEWMPVTVFKNSGGKLTDITSRDGLNNSNGWWNSIQVADMDGDGDADFLAGNLGTNAKIKASPTQPATLYVKDFDNNGRLDPILCFFKHGISVPFATRDELVKQLPFLRKKFPTYADYSKVSIVEDIFNKVQLNGALVKQAFEFHTSYIENLGKGTFRLRPLPLEAQFSPTFAMLAEDFDGDGKLDVLLGGNFSGAGTNFGLYDASYGLLLRGDGNGGFKSIDSKESGWLVKGEIRDIQNLELADGRQIILVARNNDGLKIFGWK